MSLTSNDTAVTGRWQMLAMEDLSSPSCAIWNRWLPRSPQRGRERTASSARFPRNKQIEVGMQELTEERSQKQHCEKRGWQDWGGAAGTEPMPVTAAPHTPSYKGSVLNVKSSSGLCICGRWGGLIWRREYNEDKIVPFDQNNFPKDVCWLNSAMWKRYLQPDLTT